MRLCKIIGFQKGGVDFVKLIDHDWSAQGHMIKISRSEEFHFGGSSHM